MNKYRFWLLLFILIALALRLYNLTYHSFWFDEAISVHWARQTVPRILEVGFTLVEDRLPPLYYLMLKGWAALFGFSEVSVRGLSVVFGVLLVPVVANIAATLFNRRVALSTALLVAFNPFLVWYAQEARMYAPAVFFSTLAVWAFLGICEWANGEWANGESANGEYPTGHRWTNGERRTTLDDTQHATRNTQHATRSPLLAPRSPLPASLFLALFTLAAIAGLYSHLYTGFLLPALGLWLIVSFPRTRRLWLRFALSGLVITIAFAPLAIATWRFSGEAVSGDPFSGIHQRAWWLLQAFTIWKAPLPSILRVAIPIIIALFALAAYLKSQNKQPTTHKPNPKSPIPQPQSSIPYPLLLTTLLLITPFAIANLLLFRNYLAFFGERYFIVMIPWLLLLAAVGADNLSQWAEKRFAIYALRFTICDLRLSYALPFILLFVLTTLPLPGQWSLAAAKEAWRQSVAYLAKYARPSHGILIHPDWVRYPFQFYFQGPGQTYAAFSTVTPETALDGPLQGVVGDHPVIWLIQSHLDGPDPNHLVEQWFAARYPLVTALYPPGIILKGYAPGYQLDTLPPEATPTDIRFDNGLHLIGYQADRLASATDALFHPPSGWVHVILYWTATQPVTAEAMPFVHLVGPEGIWGASLERANDALKLYPPSRWLPASTNQTVIVRHDVDVNLNPAAPPGTYQLWVGLFGDETQYPLAEVEIR